MRRWWKKKRSRKLTPKGLAYGCERRSRINGRLIRKYVNIKDLLFSTKNVVVVVEEEMGQFNGLFKILLSTYEEYHALLEDEASVKDDEKFSEIDNQVFSFKRKIMCWLKNSKQENKLKSSSGSSRCSVSKTLKELTTSKRIKILENQNHPNRRSLEVKSGLQSWSPKQSF